MNTHYSMIQKYHNLYIYLLAKTYNVIQQSRPRIDMCLRKRYIRKLWPS